jgi:hypothetical protein
MPTFNPAFFDVDAATGPDQNSMCTPTVVPDDLGDDASAVSWFVAAALAITTLGAIFAG